jgi:hypothetical protein
MEKASSSSKEKAKKSDFRTANIILFLKLLDKDELREFGKFVSSPFHNNRTEVIRFFDEIKIFHPEFTGENFTKERIFNKLYPKEEYRDDVVRRLSSNLFKLGEEYGAYKNFRENKFDFEKNLLDFYFSKNAEKFFPKQLNKSEELLNNQVQRDTEYFLRHSMLNEIERNYMLKYDPTYKKSGFEKQIINLWKHLLSSMLRLYGFAEFEIFFFNKKYELNYSQELIKIAEDSNFMDSKAIEIYYLILKLYGKDKNDKDFARVKRLIKENISIFDRGECFNLYIHLFNYCNINKLEKGIDYSKIEFEISREMVEQELLINNGVIDPGWFRGIFFKAFNAGEMDFAGEFIEKYKNKVSGNDGENVVNHAYAQLAMHEKDYDRALDYLSTATYQHLNDKWLIKNMYLKIYYETGRHEQFFYTVDSIRHLIKEEGSWNENLITPIRNFITYCTKLFRIKLREIDIPVDEVKQEILNSKVIGRPWLLEKAEELE